MEEQYKWNTVEVFSEESSAILQAPKLTKRTEKPVSLSEGLELCSELEAQGHVVEIKRID
jgi:hypothetical protein